MYLISKGGEPRQLTTSRNQLREQLKDPDSNVMAQLESETKRAIKTALLEEQRSVCCYCTGRISMDDLRVEHWMAQSVAPNLRLSWSNLFAACHGNEHGEGGRRCDVLKKNRAITLNPTNSGHLKQLRYTPSGEMLTDSEAIRSDVNEVLGLNSEELKAARKAALATFLREREFRHESASRGRLQMQLTRVQSSVAKAPADCYLAIVLDFLQRKLSNRSANE